MSNDARPALVCVPPVARRFGDPSATAELFQVDSRTVRRWIEGTRPTPKVAIDRLRAWVYALDQTAQAIIMRLGVPAVLLSGVPMVFPCGCGAAGALACGMTEVLVAAD